MEDTFLIKLDRQREKLKDRQEQQRLRTFVRRIVFFIFLSIFIVITSTIVYNYSFKKEKILFNDHIAKEITSKEKLLAEALSALITKQIDEDEGCLKEYMKTLIKQEVKVLEDKVKDYIVFRIKNEFANLKIYDKIQSAISSQIKDKIRPMVNSELQPLKDDALNYQGRAAIMDKDLRKLKEDYEILRNTLLLGRLSGTQ
ncbi:hypothetical protein DSUL_60178 [Desulfovibrionales bacterium]